VADKVEINTLSYQEGATPARWICDGSTSFEMVEGDRTVRGSDIILHINDESADFLEEGKLKEILKKYGQFLPIPIQFGMRTESIPDGEDEEGKAKYKEVEVENIINNTAPIWTKSPSELTDEDYLNFYRELYPFSEEPLFWIHLNVDYPFNLTGVLYFPKVKNELELSRNKIKLFSRQVFITDEVKDIVPEFLMLLHGVIDSPDIPLNVSRSFLQADGNVKKINNYITRKVADKLSELFKEDRKAFEEKWKDIGLFIKYGMVSDEKFYDRAKNFVLLGNVNNEHFTLSEYAEKVKAEQTNKEGNVVYLYTNDASKHHSFISNAEKRSYDVLLMDGPLDNHFISQMEQKLEKTQLKRIDSDVLDKLVEKDIKIESVLTDDESKTVKELFDKAINKKSMNVEVEGLNPDDMPVTVTMDEFMRRMKDMSKMGGGGMMGFYGTLPDNYKVSVNGNHKLIKRMLETTDEDTQKRLARQAFDLALLSQGMLTGADLTAFVERSVDLID
jgi:molecular chaperone HtpG